MSRKFFASLIIAGLASFVAVGTVFAGSLWIASQKGFFQSGAGQAAKLSIRVEAALADPNSTLVPDNPPAACATQPCGPGGALSFSVENTGNIPLRVTGVSLPCVFGGCFGSNKNTDGTFASDAFSGSCGAFAEFFAPATFNNWPLIPPHATLPVNGIDNNQLGTGMLHLLSSTPSGCQGATYQVQLAVTATNAP